MASLAWGARRRARRDMVAVRRSALVVVDGEDGAKRVEMLLGRVMSRAGVDAVAGAPIANIQTPLGFRCGRTRATSTRTTATTTLRIAYTSQ